MRNFQDTFETRKRSFISTFLIYMTVPLIKWSYLRAIKEKFACLLFIQTIKKNILVSFTWWMFIALFVFFFPALTSLNNEFTKKK